ncbi:MAG: glycogen debranching N-terminal domain-containing protein [Bdellovibrionota bacterium]
MEKAEKERFRKSNGSLTIDGISYIPSTVLLTEIQKVSLKDNRLFAVLDAKGESPSIYRKELGYYFRDTRYLTTWDLTVNGQQLIHLSHNLRGLGNSCVFTLTNRDLPTLDGKSRILRDNLLMRKIVTLYQDTVFEHIEFTNYSKEPQLIEIQQAAESSFDDIFEVRGFSRRTRGEVLNPSAGRSFPGVVLEYRGLDDKLRRTYIQTYSGTPRIELYGKTAVLTHRVLLQPKCRYDLKTVLSFDQPSDGKLAGESFREITVSEHNHLVDSTNSHAYLGEANIESDNPIFDRCIKNARLDVEMLTTFDSSTGLVYPYAGIPWFSAPFGRDGLITAYQCLPWFPNLAAGVLEYAFRTIGTAIDAFTDEEPGKIFHEVREGEMANMREVPFIPYYGSADSTPLTLILLGEYIAWTADYKRLREWWPAAKKALGWLDEWGDSDGDGFLEYIKKSATGLDNQGWKDSHDSVMYENGELARPPIKLCEVQGYAYRAKRVMALLAPLAGEPALAAVLDQQALKLRESFQRHFWDPQERYIYLALDGKNRPCKVMSSNQGHCLWSGIVDPSQSESIANHLMSARLFSGYGIRTLAADERAFNPMSYHNGSVWPHDNSIIAEGLRMYSQSTHLQSLGDALFDVAGVSDDFRLPELFCGFRRRNLEPPVPYEVACRPQAWAAGSIFLVLKALLGIQMKIDFNTVVFRNPLLPSRVSSLELKDLHIRESSIQGAVYRGRGNVCQVEILNRKGPLEVMVAK